MRALIFFLDTAIEARLSVYVGSFLAMLNARERKGQRGKSQEGETADANSLAKKLPISSGLGWGASPIAANICLTSVSFNP